MSEDFTFALMFGVVIGAMLLIIFVALFGGGFLVSAQYNYTRCITDGAPKERCIETYLLPKDKP